MFANQTSANESIVRFLSLFHRWILAVSHWPTFNSNLVFLSLELRTSRSKIVPGYIARPRVGGNQRSNNSHCTIPRVLLNSFPLRRPSRLVPGLAIHRRNERHPLQSQITQLSPFVRSWHPFPPRSLESNVLQKLTKAPACALDTLLVERNVRRYEQRARSFLSDDKRRKTAADIRYSAVLRVPLVEAGRVKKSVRVESKKEISDLLARLHKVRLTARRGEN